MPIHITDEPGWVRPAPTDHAAHAAEHDRRADELEARGQFAAAEHHRTKASYNRFLAAEARGEVEYWPEAWAKWLADEAAAKAGGRKAA